MSTAPKKPANRRADLALYTLGNVQERTVRATPKPKPSIRQKSLGKCPKCGRTDWWLNDVPLRGFCWGTEEKPHKEVSKLVPAPFNPYLKGK